MVRRRAREWARRARQGGLETKIERAMAEKIGLVGAGQMARALAAGFVRAGLLAPSQILAADPSPTALDAFAKAVSGAKICLSNGEVAREAGLIVLAVKPQQITSALAEIRGNVGLETLVVSIAAGVRLAT